MATKFKGEENETQLTTNNAIIQLSSVGFRFMHWREVARRLQIKRDDMDRYIKKYYGDEATALEECVDDWLRNSREPTWDKFLHIIASVDKSAARQIRKSIGLPPGTFRSDIAHRVMTEWSLLIKNCGIDIHLLFEKLLERKVINIRQKRRITDGCTKRTASEIMDKLLNLIFSPIRAIGEVFGIFLDILREEGTRRTIALADKLLQKYYSFDNAPDQVQFDDSTFKSDIAHRIMTENASLIKNCGIDVSSLAEKLMEHNIVNAREKREIVNGNTEQSDGERMDKVLHIISSSIRMDEEVFGIFLDILREEGTRKTIKLADKLLQEYRPNQVQCDDYALTKWLQEGEVNLTVKRVQMLGPPGSGKTCTLRLLLNEDPPKEALIDSTPIACRAVKATRISVADGCMKEVNAKTLLSRLACDLKEEVSKQKETTTDKYDTKSKGESSETIPTDSHETKATESVDLTKSVDATESADDPDANKMRKNIVEAIPTAKANLNCNWVYIVDSGGQTAFQELLPLFTRPASLNIITLDLSKDLDEKLDLQYRIDGTSYPCDSEFSYSNIEFLEDILSSGAVSQPYHNKFPGYFVLGTHSDDDKATPDKIKKFNEELSSLTSGSKVEKGYRIIPAKLGEILYSVNTMLKSGPDRQKISKKLCDIILNDRISNDTLKMPVRWFAFELTLLKKAGNGSCLKKHDVLSIGKSLEMKKEDTEQALLYLHNATIVLYYPEVLPDIVFVDPHPILDTLSRLLALTYNIDVAHLYLLTKAGVDILDSDDLSKLRKRGIFTKSLLDMLNGDQGFSTSDFIKLLLQLHIIAKTEDGYFIPSALPPYTGPPPESDVINPLVIVWRNPVSEEILPVPRGIFPLAVVNLRTFKQPEFRFPTKDTSTHQKYLRCRDAMSFRVFVHKEKIGTIHLIKKNKCIEIYSKGKVLKHCPLILEAVTEAINSSSEAINLKPDGHEFAFACCSKDCYCIVMNEIEEKVECLCDELVIISGQEKYWSWFHVTYQNPATEGPKLFDIKDLKEILKLLREGHFNGDWEGLGIELGLYQHPTLSNIQHNCTKEGEAALRKCLTSWLLRVDAVDENGGATCVSLANALDTLGQKAVADHIRREYQIHSQQQETKIIKGTPHILDIFYIRDIRSSLKNGNFNDSKWHDLGAQLCLLPDTLKTIEDDHSSISRCLRETLLKWLEGADDASPSWGSLVKALEAIKENEAAEHIRCKWIKRKHT